MKKGVFIIIVLLLCGLIAKMVLDDQDMQRQKQAELEQIAQTSQNYYVRMIQINREMELIKKESQYQGKRPYIIRVFTVFTPQELQTAAELAEKHSFPLVIAIDVNESPEMLEPLLAMLGMVDCEYIITGSPVTEAGLELAKEIRKRLPAQDGRCYLLRGGDAMGKTIENLMEDGFTTVTMINGLTSGWLENGVNYMEYTYFEETSELYSPERTVKAELARQANSMNLICFDLGALTSGKLTMAALEEYFSAFSTEYCSGIKEAVQAIEMQKADWLSSEAERTMKLEALQAEFDELNDALNELTLSE